MPRPEKTTPRVAGTKASSAKPKTTKKTKFHVMRKPSANQSFFQQFQIPPVPLYKTHTDQEAFPQSV